MLYSQQIRAARALLGWTQERLAEQAGIGAATLKRLEARPGRLSGNAQTVWQIQGALEAAGVAFIAADRSGGPGVRLTEPTTPRLRGPRRQKD